MFRQANFAYVVVVANLTGDAYCSGAHDLS